MAVEPEEEPMVEELAPEKEPSPVVEEPQPVEPEPSRPEVQKLAKYYQKRKRI